MKYVGFIGGLWDNKVDLVLEATISGDNYEKWTNLR